MTELAGPSPGARVYGYRGYAIFQGVAIAGLTATLLWLFWVYLSDDVRAPLIGLAMIVVLFLVPITILASQLWTLLARVAVDERGLWSLIPGRPPVFLAWDAITKIEEHELRQFLLVSDTTGRSVRIEYQARDFAVLRRQILERARNLVPSRQRLFVRSRAGLVHISVCAAGVIPLLTRVHVRHWSGIVIGTALLFAAFIARAAWQRIEIRDHELVQGRGRLARVTPFSEIEEVSLAAGADSVVLRMQGGKTLALPGLGQPQALYESLNLAWLAARGESVGRARPSG